MAPFKSSRSICRCGGRISAPLRNGWAARSRCAPLRAAVLRAAPGALGPAPGLRPPVGSRSASRAHRPAGTRPAAGPGAGFQAGGGRPLALGAWRAMPCGQPSGGAAPALYVVGVDVGSTAVKCHVYDRAAAVRGSGCRKVIAGGAGPSRPGAGGLRAGGAPSCNGVGWRAATGAPAVRGAAVTPCVVCAGGGAVPPARMGGTGSRSSVEAVCRCRKRSCAR